MLDFRLQCRPTFILKNTLMCKNTRNLNKNTEIWWVISQVAVTFLFSSSFDLTINKVICCTVRNVHQMSLQKHQSVDLFFSFDHLTICFQFFRLKNFIQFLSFAVLLCISTRWCKSLSHCYKFTKAMDTYGQPQMSVARKLYVIMAFTKLPIRLAHYG